jgi:hypothetical protein
MKPRKSSMHLPRWETRSSLSRNQDTESPAVPSPQSQSFFRSYGSNLPTSLIYFILKTRGYKPWRPDAVYGTAIGEITTSPEFSKTTETSSDISILKCYSNHYAFSPVHLISRQLIVRSGDNAFRESPMCTRVHLRCRAVSNPWCRNINPLPFRNRR